MSSSVFYLWVVEGMESFNPYYYKAEILSSLTITDNEICENSPELNNLYETKNREFHRIGRLEGIENQWAKKSFLLEEIL